MAKPAPAMVSTLPQPYPQVEAASPAVTHAGQIEEVGGILKGNRGWDDLPRPNPVAEGPFTNVRRGG